MQQPGKTKGFLCKHCGIACSNMPSLLEHTETCHQSGDDRKFKCDECGRGYRHGGSLANHKKTHETGSFECQICTRKLSNALALKSHLRIHTSKKYTCMDCGKGFNLANQLATHQKVHCSREFLEKTRNRELKQTQAGSTCDDEHVDGQDFDMISELPSDLELDVAPDSNLSNGMMSELIPSSTAEPDLAGDDEDRPFKCDMCEKTYRHNGSLINHKKSHQMGIFECSVCFKQFNNLAALTSHHRTHSKPRGHPSTVSPLSPEAYTDSMPAEVSNVLQNGASNIHFCHLCQSAFPNDDEFQNHIMLHNSSSVSFELPASTPEDHPFSYSINESPESNPYPSSSDTPPLPLLLDNAVDYDQTQGPMENGHIYVPHPIGDEPTLLDTQGEHLALPSLENLKHEPLEQASDDKKDQASSSDRRFKCHICGKSYRHAGSLINHKRSHQTGIFQCSICRKNYPHLAALRSHLRIHKGRPSMVIPSAEGDWLSSEPLTHENQHGGFPHEDDVSGILGLPQDLGDSVNMNSDEENIIDLDGSEFREQFDSSFSEDRHVDLPQGEARVERHMCADCGKTFTDIAQIKSHTCPLLNQQCHSNSFSQDCEMDFKSADYKHTVGDLGEQMVFERQKGSGDTYFHDAVDEQMMGDNENMLDCKDGNEENEEEEDGEMYQCSVCRNHYTSMQALRTHLRGHTQIHGTPSTSGPSSMSSIEAEKDEEAGQVQHGDCDLIICSTCGESFTKKQDLLAHQLLHSNTVDGQPEQYKTRNQSEHQPKEESESIICGTCGVVCTSVAQLESHNCTEQGDDRLDEYDNKADIVNESGQVCEYFSESPGNGGGRLHKCDQCGRSYRHSASLLNHKNSHKTGVFRCFVCQKRFYNLLALKNHQRTHFDVKKHSCTECGKAFKIHKQLLNHQRVHQENKAKIEELNKQIQALMEMSGSVSVSGMQAVSTGRKRRGRRRKQKNIPCSDQSSPEKNSHSGDPNDPRPFVCDQCGRSYRHAGSLVNHKNSHKTGEYYCAVCNNTYSNQLAMRNHLRIHFSVKKHCCQDCGKAFRGKKQLLNHTCKHNRKNAALKGKGRGRRRVKDLTCKNCNLLFPNAELLAGHTCSKEHDPRSTFAVVDRNCKVEASVVKEERPFECNICGRSYRHAGSLLNHKNTHKTGHFTCSFCAKPFSNPMALRNHTRIHTQKKKYVCTTCGKAFRLSSILYNHQKIHARGVIHYSCHTCGKRFQGKSGLKRHRCYRNGSSSSPLSLDGGDKCYTCDQCGRSYRHAGSLLNHKKTHSADLLHCSLCLKTFTDHLELQRHSQMARHCCPDCGKTFCEFGHLQSHMEVHSKGLPYYCSVCQQNFPNMASFEQHQQVHHSMQEQSCHQQDVQMSHSLDWDSGISQQLGLQNISKMGQEFSQMHEGMSDQEDQHESGGAFDKEKSHVCEHCGRSYRHAGSLLNHKNSHKTGSFFCSVCQKEFTNLMALKNHRRIHTEPKRYQCLECGKAFRVSTQLICHRRIHTKERPFACILCDKRFSSKSNLRHHQKLHQNAQQTFESFTMDPNAFMGLGVEPFL